MSRQVVNYPGKMQKLILRIPPPAMRIWPRKAIKDGTARPKKPAAKRKIAAKRKKPVKKTTRKSTKKPIKKHEN
jgi:hypothetical protein